MTGPRRGDIFYAPLQHTDLIEGKKRPVCVISTDSYNQAGPDVVVAMITSRLRLVERPGIGDVPIGWETVGLARPSVLRAGRLMTLDISLLGERVGSVSDEDLDAISVGLGAVLGLAS